MFALLSLVFIGLMNRWDSSVETIAIILFSVVVSVLIALPLGILGARSNRADTAMRPVLDGMQTMPSYVYLVPGILFFGLGYTPAVIATVIYAVPPAIRLTNLGIVRYPRLRWSRPFLWRVADADSYQGPSANGLAYHHGRHQSDYHAGSFGWWSSPRWWAPAGWARTYSARCNARTQATALSLACQSYS